MHNDICFTYLSLRNPGQDVLFSGAQDYRASIEVIANLSKSHTPIGAFCLLEQEVHLIAIADKDAGQALSGALMQALTGNRDHPLGRHWRVHSIEPKYVAGQIAQIHLLPCLAGLCSTPDIYRWSSHQAFSQPALAPSWLATEAIWRQLTPRFSNRVRAYLHQLDQYSAHQVKSTHTPHSRKSPQGLSGKAVAEWVLEDHQTRWTHLTHRRSRGRKMQLAGLSSALCHYLQLPEQEHSVLSEVFGLSPEELNGLARLASREASQYIITSANKLSAPNAVSHAEEVLAKPGIDTAFYSDTENSAAQQHQQYQTHQKQPQQQPPLAPALDDYESQLLASADDIELSLDFTSGEDTEPNQPTIRLVAGR